MARLNGMGPENKGLRTGRGLGNCNSQVDAEQYGKGMGMRRKQGCGQGLGRRLQSGK